MPQEDASYQLGWQSMPLKGCAENWQCTTCASLAESHQVLIVGGSEAEATGRSELLEFGLAESWRLSHLNSFRQHPIAASMGEHTMIVAGGWNATQGALRTVETWTARKPEWKLATNTTMSTPRILACAVSLETSEGDVVLVMGGRTTPLSGSEVKSVEFCRKARFVNADNGPDLQWTRLGPSMNERRAGAAAVVVKDSSAKQLVIIMGGFNGKEWTKSCEVYDMLSESVSAGLWKKLNSMPVSIKSPQAVSLQYEGSTFVLVAGSAGSVDGVICCYHVENKQWTWQKSGEEFKTCCHLSVQSNRLFVLNRTREETVAYSCSLVELFDKSPRSSPAADPGSAPASPTRTSAVSPSQNSAPSFRDNDAPPLPLGVALNEIEKFVYKVGDYGTQRYSGQIRSDTSQPHGQGLLEFGDKNGEFHPLDADRNNYYRGSFAGGYRHGLGELYLCGQDKFYCGDFRRNAINGFGTLEIKSQGFRYVGNFQDGQMHGSGRCTFRSSVDGYFCYDGSWKNDRAHGKGTIVERTSGHVVISEGKFKEEDLTKGWKLPVAVAQPISPRGARRARPPF